MIEINLLPDVKREYLKTQQVKHSVIVGSVLVSAVAIVVTALLYSYVQVVQPQHRKNVQKDIDAHLSDIKAKPNATKIVTVQGVLEQISGLQDKKTITSNLFGYLTSFTPRDVSYGEVTLDVTQNSLALKGEASTYEGVNILANNLKSAQFTYKSGDSTQTIKPFSAVVFQTLSKADQSSTSKSVGFQLTITFDPVMFNQATSAPSLKVDASSEQLLLPDAKLFNTGAAQ